MTSAVLAREVRDRLVRGEHVMSCTDTVHFRARAISESEWIIERAEEVRCTEACRSEKIRLAHFYGTHQGPYVQIGRESHPLVAAAKFLACGGRLLPFTFAGPSVDGGAR